MNKDQSKGRAEEAKGKVKQVTGKAVGNRELEHKGRIQKAGGKIPAGWRPEGRHQGFHLSPGCPEVSP